MTSSHRVAIAVLVGCAACTSSGASTSSSGGGAAGTTSGRGGAAATSSSESSTTASSSSTGSGGACKTRVQYGEAYIHPANHPGDSDTIDGLVTWDGTCTNVGANSVANLSDGSQVQFTGHSACIIALDTTPGCGTPQTCATRVSYGAGWTQPANHPDHFDDFMERVFSDGSCKSQMAPLSNGDSVSFSNNACPLSFRYTECGGLYTNPVMPTGCADPGVLHDTDGTYVLSCTSGGAANAFPIYTSPDLAHWKHVGSIFPQGNHPAWTTGAAFWAPEIHKVGNHYVAYFSATDSTTGLNEIGAASAPTATGPFTPLAHPIVSDSTIGLIDASEINTSSGEAYLIWKVAGLAVHKPTPIHSQKLSPDGLSVTGPVATLITNDQAWEGPSTEGPFMVEHGGMFYLFYSGGVYTNASYAVGVARGTSPNAPMTKLMSPILTTNANWVGPGHCSVVTTNANETAIFYHAWQPNCVGQAGCDRSPLLDLIHWGGNGWPSVELAPSSTTRPLP